MKSNKLAIFVFFSVILCISMLGSASAAGNNSTGLSDSPYSTVGVNNGHTGQSNYTGPQTNTTKWKNSITGPSVIGSDGTIYVTSFAGSLLYALNADGTVKWNKTVTGPRGLAIGNNDTIYVVVSVSSTNGLYAFSSDGTNLWSYNATGSTGSTNYPIVSSDGTIYFGWSKYFYAVNPDGTPKWSKEVTLNYQSSAIGSDGRIYVLTGGKKTSILYAFNADGTDKWSVSASGASSGIAIGPNGTLYCVISYNGFASSGYLTAFNPSDGSIKWQYTNVSNFQSVPVVSSDGTIYVESLGNVIYAFNSDGTVKWTYNCSSKVYSKFPIIGADGTFYIGDSSGNVYAMNPDKSVKWVYNTGSSFSSAMIGSDGTLYLVTDGGIVAIQDFVADFSGDVSGLSVNFTDNSSNLPTTWVWDFGDGNSSDQQNPTHIYSNSGTYDVTLLVINGSGDSRTVTKSVTVSQAPVLNPVGDKNVAANETLNFTVSGSDPDGDTLTYSATGLPSGATFDPATGVFSWTPSASQVGSYVVTFTVSDGVSSVIQDVTIVVGKANTAPVLNPVEDKIVDENQALNFIVGGSDVDGDNLTYTATGLPDGATFDSSTGAFSWTPTYSQAGVYHVTFTVSDGKLTDSKTMTITVNNVNQAPILNPVEDKSVDETKSLSFTVSGSDPDNNGLTYSATNLPDGATYNSTTGAFSWTPTYSQAGVYHVTFTVSDGKLTDSKTMTITVNNVNRAPSLDSIEDKNVNESKTIIFNVHASDPDGDTLTYTANELPAGASFNSTTGAFSWTPTYSQAGTYTITFTVSDGTLMDINTVTITVKDVDTVAPTVKSVDPAYKAAVNNAGKVVKVTFSEAVKMGTGWIELQKTNGTKVAVKTATNGNTLYIAANSALANGTYRVLLHSGCVTDLAGNSSGSSVSYFTVDTTAPKVKAVYPKNASVTRNVSKVMVVCNETMKMGTGWIELQKTNGTKIAIRTAVSGSTLYIAPTSALSNGTYRVILHGGCLIDQAGNRLAGYLSYFTIKK